MVMESLESPVSAEKKPWEMFFIGILYSTVAIFLSNWIFKDYASMIMVFLIVLACVPLLYHTNKYEEKKDILSDGKEMPLLKEHSRAITFLIALFLGCTLSMSFWYVVLPSELVHSSFDAQVTTIQAINSRLTGNAASMGAFTNILLNNLKVLVFCILFAFLYGAGAIFILVWNSSVIAAAIGNNIRINLANIAGGLGFDNIASYLSVVSVGVMRYMFHGIPEIAAYFVGGLAGGIISVAVIREKFGTKNFEKVVLDSSDLVLISVVILIFAAFVEVYITPLLFL